MYLRSFFILLLFVPSLDAIQQAPTLDINTIKRYLTPIQKIAQDNKKSLQRIAKAGAALFLLKGLYNVTWDQVNIVRPYSEYKNNEISTIQDLVNEILFPRAWLPNSGHTCTGGYISSPPYFTALAISAYLLGCSVYKKIGTWTKERFILNKHALNIVKNCTKIGGAYLLLKGHYKLMYDQINSKRSNIPKKLSLVDYPRHILSPTICHNSKESRQLNIIEISRPPYISALGIAAYLLGTGCHGIYKEVHDWIQEHKNKGLSHE